MTPLVVDASALVALLVYDDKRSARIEERLRGERLLFAPNLIDYEVVSALRGLARVDKRLTAEMVEAALVNLGRLRIRRFEPGPLMPRVWELRHNLTVYDAAYVALAESLGGALLTCDERIARAGGVRCPVETAE